MVSGLFVSFILIPFMRAFFFWLFLLILTATLTASAWFGLYVTTPSPGEEQIMVTIPKGAGVRRIMQILGRQGIIKDDVRFLILARLVKEGKQLKAGEFQIPQGLTPLEVLRFLATARPVQYRVTIPEGLTMDQIARIFARDNWVDSKIFLKLCLDKEYIQEVGIQADSLEGYLFPETYTLVRGTVNERKIIANMVHRFQQIWDKLEKPDTMKLSRHQFVTLASIVEKETGSAGERAKIAGVFYNRLNKGMRLQSDPTTIYGLKNFNGNLTRADLSAKTPYNTYVIAGLPPGPICNPGQAALEAALHPAEVPYYYFVSKNDGSHYFSTTLKEHNRAVYRYQKSKNKGKHN
jgi:UPF0755 protein